VRIRIKKATRRRDWLAIGAMGSLVAYTAVGGKGVHPIYSAAPLGQTPAHTINPTQTVPIFKFDISSGLLDSVIQAFEQTSGNDIVFSREGIGRLPSPGARGEYSAEEALRQILAGTGVSFRYTASDTITLDLNSVAEMVQVTTPAPIVAPSSPKFTQPLRDIPQTITVIPQSIMQQQGATTLRDVLRNVTGISIQAGEGSAPAGDNLSIRGFNARSDMFVDGVRDFGGYTRDPFNVEQVEISKGPSSAYSGRGSTGGSVNLASKAPGLLPLRSVSVGGGSAAYKRTTIDINEPIRSLKGAAFRFNGMFTDANTPGRNAIENRRWGAAPSLAFGLQSATKVTLSYLHLDQDNMPEYGLPWVPNTNVPLEAYRDGAPPVSLSNFYGLRNRDFEKTFTRMGTTEVRHDFNDSFSVRSLVRYGRTRRDSLITAPRFTNNTSTDINRQLQSRDQTDDVVASQTNLIFMTSTGSVGHSIVGGIELARETSQNFARMGPAAPLADLFNPDPDDLYFGPITRTGASTNSTGKTAAIYAGDTAEIDKHWQLTGSLRLDNFNLDYKSTATTGAVTPFARTDRMLSGRAGLVFKPQESGSIYFGYGTSFNPSAEGLSLAASTADLQPEKSKSYEVGTKWDLYTNHVAVNAAYFRTLKINARTPGVNPGDPPTVLDGRQHVDGVELGLIGDITRRWQAIGGYTFMSSKIDQSNNAAEAGREFANTPRHSFNIWTDYQFTWKVDIGGGINYVGDRFASNTLARVAAGYWVADVTAAYHVTERLSLRLNVTNLTNERYIDRLYTGHFIPGPGRLAMITTDFRF
jgi:catecholate siderophore receptor